MIYILNVRWYKATGEATDKEFENWASRESIGLGYVADIGGRYRIIYFDDFSYPFLFLRG